MAMLRRIGQSFIGLMCGATLGYCMQAALGLVIASWPFNLLFTPLAASSLVLQASYWQRMYREPGLMRQGMVGGLMLMGALWLFYFQV